MIFKVLYYGRKETFAVNLENNPLMFYQLSCVHARPQSVRIDSQDSSQPGFQSRLKHLPTQGSWSERITSLCRHLFISNVRIVMVPTSESYCED